MVKPQANCVRRYDIWATARYNIALQTAFVIDPIEPG
jgi:hypothetical protein